MKNEIKEILEHIKIYPEKLYCLSEKEKRILLDYITNLQEENERLRKDYGRLMQNNAYTLELEQRNEKAIEYIIKNSEMYDEDLCTDVNFELVDLLNILGGDDNE